MLRWLTRLRGVQASNSNSWQRSLSSASSSNSPPDQPGKKPEDFFEDDIKEIKDSVKKEVKDKRKSFIEEENEMSTYEKLTKMYVEQNVNKFDSEAARRDLNDELPLERAFRVIKNDFTLKSLARFMQPDNMVQYGTSDFLIIGSGISASMLAFFLKTEIPQIDVTVVEEDSLIGCEPLGINGESLIMQWNMPHYIKMANFSYQFYQSLPDLMGKDSIPLKFTPYGSLFLSSSVEDIDGRCSVYDGIDWKYERMKANVLSASFPWLNLDGVEEGVHGLRSEGWVDPWSALACVRRLAMSAGVHYVKGVLTSVVFNQHPGVDSEDRNVGEVDAPRIAIVKLADKSIETFDFTNIVLASGLRNRFNSRKLHIGNGPGFLRVELPLRIRKRFMFRIRCLDSPIVDFPLVMDPSGFRIRREGFSGRYLCWREPSADEEPDVSNLDVDMDYFEEKIRKPLVERIPAFKTAEVESCWAGFIDINEYDGEPIIGLHPSYGNVFLITGLGSHELALSPAIAKASAELLLQSEYKTLDCSAFLLDRVLFQDPIRKPSSLKF